MGEGTEAMAERIRAAEPRGFLAGREALHTMLADEVMVTRVPPFPEDGVRDQAAMLEMWHTEAAAFEKSLTNPHQEEVEVSVDGDTIDAARTLCGTAPDGTEIRARLRNRLTVAGGRVVAIEAHINDEDRERMRAVILAGGVRHADFGASDD